MRVFLDTNVLVSAFATRGLCADVLEVVLLEHELVTGSQAIDELERALRAKLKLPAAHTRAIVEYVSAAAAQVVQGAAPAPARVEPDDARVLGEALAADAGLFVTGDRALLELGAVGDMPIVSPRGFWESLRKA